jgi:HTH-type transcriptional regulator / antitoxin HigA
MTLKILRTKKEYSLALKRFEKIFQSKAGTADGDQADVLALLIREYEDKHYVIEAPSPLEAIRYRMEQQGLSNKDLVAILGYKSRVTDLFKKHRKLTIGMIRKLHDELRIPLETLVKEY